MGFQGFEFKQPRSGSSATPYIHPEARHANQKKNRTKVTGNTDVISRVRASIICRNEGDSHAGEVLRSNPETQVIVVPFFGSRKPSGNSGTKVDLLRIGFPSHMQLFVVDDDSLDRLCCLSLNHRTANHSGGATIFRTFPGT